MSPSPHHATSVIPVMKANSTLQMYDLARNESDRPSSEQLAMAFNALCRAVSLTAQDERNAAEQLLQRAATLLNLKLERVKSDAANEKSADKPEERGLLAPWQARKIKDYIESNLGSNLTVAQLAACVGRSSSHFSRVFKITFGEPPHRYVQRRRIERSQGMMLATAKSIADIALDCGLADQAHLGRLFRNIVGETPGAWRRARAEAP